MSLKDVGLLLSFIAEGIAALKKFCADEAVRRAFFALKTAQTDADRANVARAIAGLLYSAPAAPR